MLVAVYCRVSTEDQAEAKTIENQVEFAQKYCAMHNLKIYKFYLDDGVSGSIPVSERPAGRRLLEDGRAGYFKTVYVYRLDRLARTTLDLLNTHEQLSQQGISLKSMTENFDTSTPSGKFFMTTLGGIAEIERATIAERMKLGKARALKEGRWPGGPPPYGYRLKNKRLAIEEQQAAVVKLIFDLYTGEAMDTVAIADYLTAAGYLSPGGETRWYGSKVWSILTNSAYRGVFLYGKQRGANKQHSLACPPIIDADQWEQAQQKLKQNHFNARRNARYPYLLRGLIKCGRCGRSYCGDGSHSKGRYRYYRCTGNSSFRGKLVQKCRSKYVRADKIESVVLQDILNYIKGNGDLLTGLQQHIIAAEQGSYAKEALVDLTRAVAAKEQEKGRVLSLFRKGLINDHDVKLQLRAIEQEKGLLAQRQAKINSLWEQTLLLKQGRYSIPGIIELLEQRLYNGDVALLRQLIKLLVHSIVVHTVEEQGRRELHVNIEYYFGGP